MDKVLDNPQNEQIRMLTNYIETLAPEVLRIMRMTAKELLEYMNRSFNWTNLFETDFLKIFEADLQTLVTEISDLGAKTFSVFLDMDDARKLVMGIYPEVISIKYLGRGSTKHGF